MGEVDTIVLTLSFTFAKPQLLPADDTVSEENTKLTKGLWHRGKKLLIPLSQGVIIIAFNDTKLIQPFNHKSL